MVMQNKGTGACIPVIDMKDFVGQSEKLMEACRDWGCFRIINHNIPESLMMEMKAVSRSLLDLPVEVKLRNCDPVQGKGYTPPHKASSVFEGLGCYDRAVGHFCWSLSHRNEDSSIFVTPAIKIPWDVYSFHYNSH